MANCTFSQSPRGAIVTSARTGAGVNISLNNCTFSSNYAAILCYALDGFDKVGQSTLLFVSNSLFIRNKGPESVVGVYKTSLTIQGSRFVLCQSGSSVVAASISSGVLIEETKFDSNTARFGILNCNDVDVRVANSMFENNLALRAGGAIYLTIYDANYINIENSVFRNNTALSGSGGGIYFERVANIDKQIKPEFRCFHKNCAEISLISIFFEMESCAFQDNYATVSGGAVYTTSSVKNEASSIKQNVIDTEKIKGLLHLFYMTNITYTNNQAGKSGGAAMHFNPPITGLETQALYTRLIAVGNEAGTGGAIYMENFALEVDTGNSKADIDILFANNRARGEGGALHVMNSRITLSAHTNVLVENNTADEEGAGWFLDRSHIEMQVNACVTFKGNRIKTASGKGGAIFVRDDKKCEDEHFNYIQCFFSVSESKAFKFITNIASKGFVLYGGLLDVCRINNLTGIDYFKKISVYESSPKAIASDPASCAPMPHK